jgi:hypothetical protein
MAKYLFYVSLRTKYPVLYRPTLACVVHCMASSNPATLELTRVDFIQRSQEILPTIALNLVQERCIIMLPAFRREIVIVVLQI